MEKDKNNSISLEGAKCIEIDEDPSSGDKVIEISNNIGGDKVIETSVSGGKVIDASQNKGRKAHKRTASKQKTDTSFPATVSSKIIQGLQSLEGAFSMSGTSSFKSIYCPNCGKKYYKFYSRYCTQCGQQRK